MYNRKSKIVKYIFPQYVDYNKKPIISTYLAIIVYKFQRAGEKIDTIQNYNRNTCHKSILKGR